MDITSCDTDLLLEDLDEELACWVARNGTDALAALTLKSIQNGGLHEIAAPAVPETSTTDLEAVASEVPDVPDAACVEVEDFAVLGSIPPCALDSIGLGAGPQTPGGPALWELYQEASDLEANLKQSYSRAPKTGAEMSLELANDLFKGQGAEGSSFWEPGFFAMHIAKKSWLLHTSQELGLSMVATAVGSQHFQVLHHDNQLSQQYGPTHVCKHSLRTRMCTRVQPECPGQFHECAACRAAFAQQLVCISLVAKRLRCAEPQGLAAKVQEMLHGITDEDPHQVICNYEAHLLQVLNQDTTPVVRHVDKVQVAIAQFQDHLERRGGPAARPAANPTPFAGFSTSEAGTRDYDTSLWPFNLQQAVPATPAAQTCTRQNLLGCVRTPIRLACKALRRPASVVWDLFECSLSVLGRVLL